MEPLYIILAILGLLIYFLPAMLAWYWGRRNATAILVLNIFLGWTLVGWVGALVWAFVEDR